MASSDPSEVRRRTPPHRPDTEEYAPLIDDDDGDEEYDPNLPYGGKVYLARKKKPDTLTVRILEGLLIAFTVFFIYYAYFHFDNLHFHVTHAYAHMGHAQAMHLVGQRYLNGKGVDQSNDKAMEWFRYAADKGHPHSSHNLAVGHLQGYNTDVSGRDEVKKLLKFAASKGVSESHDALAKLCPQGDC
ncbi:secretory immunoglobulin A-binding protein EsiB-like [Ptychodera flava]|uniref:secretory immunoglobulin A-binding protein EsiB-like n=1 Tax=Ptychodera flava TaxID=63121 RepID=UPI00396A327A